MESRLASVLTVLSVAITTIVVTAYAVSPVLGLYLAAVSGFALVAWLVFGRAGAAEGDSAVGPYLLALVLVLALATCRYMGGAVQLLGGPLRDWFAAGFPITISSWFLAFAVAPVSLMLLGGYYLVKRMPIGGYMAWWSALYAIADGLLQFAVQLKVQQEFGVASAGALLVSMAQIFAGVTIGQRLLRPLAQAATPAGGALTPRQRNLWTLLFASVVGVYAVALFRSAGALPLIIVVGSMLGGLVGWRLTTAIRPIDPARAVPLFLVLLTLFYLHVGEESLTQFNRGIAMLSDQPWSDHDFTLLIGLAGPVVFFLSAWSLWKRQPFGNFVFWFFVVGMILGEPTHLLVFPVVSMHKFGGGYQYFSGMYTALFPMIPAIVGLVMIVSEHRRSRSAVR